MDEHDLKELAQEDTSGLLLYMAYKKTVHEGDTNKYYHQVIRELLPERLHTLDDS